MRRRGPGVAAIKNKDLAQARYRNKGEEIASDQLAQLSKQLGSFRSNLEEFAKNHKDDIRRSPEFRVQFQEMCASIGVDPLASGKGFWSEMLGVGDFYYELAVQVIEVCMATNHLNGGLIPLTEMRTKVAASRGQKSEEISTSDVLTAIRKLKALGNGFTLIPFGDTFLVQSVPGELTMDHTTVLQQAESTGFITRRQMKELGWEDERTNRALDYMLKESLAWVDYQAKPETQYWFPGLFPDANTDS